MQAADTIADLEQHVQQLKQAVETAEQQRAKQMRVGLNVYLVASGFLILLGCVMPAIGRLNIS